MRLIANLLSLQDPHLPHTPLTRVIVIAIILFASLVYAGFFGVLGAVAVYLVAIELLGGSPLWLYAPILIALIAGLVSASRSIADYWSRYAGGRIDPAD